MLQRQYRSRDLLSSLRESVSKIGACFALVNPSEDALCWTLIHDEDWEDLCAEGRTSEHALGLAEPRTCSNIRTRHQDDPVYPQLHRVLAMR